MMHSKRKATDNEVELPAKFSRIDEVLSRGNNSLMQLNEIGIKGLKWTIQQISNMFPQKFRATCVFGDPFSGSFEVIPSGTSFYCEGLSKAACKHDIANQIMDRLSGKNKPPNGNQTVISKPILIVPESVDDSESTNNDDSVKLDSAVRILNEKMRDIVYNFVLHEDGYCCYVSFRGFVIKGVGANKKLAKRVVAAKILKKYYKVIFTDDNKSMESTPKLKTNSSVALFDRIPKSRQKQFSNMIQAMVKNGYEKLVSSLDIQYSKRKVLAGIIISRKLSVVFPDYQCGNFGGVGDVMTIDPVLFFTRTGWNINPDDGGEILKLVTISSGTKCLSGSDISDGGLVVNDCHAEVISKRAMQFFIAKAIWRYENLINFAPQDQLYGCDIVEPVVTDAPQKQTVYKIKDDVKVHLFVSSAPCGDSRIFFPQSLNSSMADELEEESVLDESVEDTHPNRKNRGLLRTKIECGEGTIPIKTKHIQTWDGILGGERLLTMSCSDKVCTWNVLGIQGALLSNILSHPVYLNSVTIGSLFHQDHLERALYERAQGVTEEPEWRQCSTSTGIDEMELGELYIETNDNIDKFQVSTPYILTVDDQTDRCPGKASNFSVNWIVGEDGFEIISTTKGTKIDNSPSRLCKRNLFKQFLDVFKWVAFVNNDNGHYGYNEMKALQNVPERALSAHLYQKKKIALFKYFDRQNFGFWIGKPTEQDWFGLQAPSN